MSRNDLTSFSLSLLIHIAILGAVWFIILQTPTPQRDIRLEVVLNPGVPLTQQETQQPAADSAETATPATAPAEEQPVQQTPQETPAPVPAAAPASQPASVPATTPRPSTTSPAAATAGSAANQPAAIPENTEPQSYDWEITKSDSTTSSTDVSSFLNNDENSGDQVPEGFNPEASSSSSSGNAPTTKNSTSSSTSDVSAAEVDAQLAQLRANMNSDYISSSSDSASTAQVTSIPGVALDPGLFSGDIVSSGRKLVSEDRLDLSRYLSELQPNWPASITVEFEVNAEGFVTILNDASFSAYNQLALAVYRLFSGSPVFKPAAGAPAVRGAVKFQIR